ncbi:YlzJ-like family protein [Paenibacillus sp. N3/727]|uniref:YlzJ-like family protein n=1 Tax=Paenibacillus sp. N3/727 TaxID=2925845 RepID=UPI001F533D8A|nr:YlzJ-like family protein [Paenibacillus sp. N3/727]UNK16648.1 YlzJ-like family protein [Paenibacillus sp. N3/727]
MTLYTVMPQEVIWMEETQLYQPAQTMELQIGSLLMQVELLSDNKAKILRLLSCELGDYLNPLYAPGSTISFVPVIGTK